MKKKPCVYSDVAYLQYSGHRHYSSGCSRVELKSNFAYLEVSIHILGWVCCILQSNDVCISLDGNESSASVCVCQCLRAVHSFPATHTYTRIHPRVPDLLGIMNFTVMALGVTMSPLSHYFTVNKTNQIRPFEAERDGFRRSGSWFSFCQLF